LSDVSSELAAFFLGPVKRPLPLEKKGFNDGEHRQILSMAAILTAQENPLVQSQRIGSVRNSPAEAVAFCMMFSMATAVISMRWGHKLKDALALALRARSSASLRAITCCTLSKETSPRITPNARNKGVRL